MCVWRLRRAHYCVIKSVISGARVELLYFVYSLSLSLWQSILSVPCGKESPREMTLREVHLKNLFQVDNGLPVAARVTQV